MSGYVNGRVRGNDHVHGSDCGHDRDVHVQRL